MSDQLKWILDRPELRKQYDGHYIAITMDEPRRVVAASLSFDVLLEILGADDLAFNFGNFYIHRFV